MTSSQVPDWVFHWNPLKPVVPGRIGRKLPVRRRVNNFGDLLGPRIVTSLLTQAGAADHGMPEGRRLFSVGSVMHYATDGDVIWGSGINGKIPMAKMGFTSLDVRAVRGPRTAKQLRERGIAVPDIFGDPALLIPTLDARLKKWSSEKRYEVTIVPNLNDMKSFRGIPNVLDPRSPLDFCMERIARSEVVLASSLHGIVLGEIAGAVVVPFLANHEPLFKYDDYFEGTGRDRPDFAPDLDSARQRVAKHSIPTGPFDYWKPQPLLQAFPWDTIERKAYS